MSESFEYDVAISFAGEERRFAEFVAKNLCDEFRVFYDEFEKSKLWGEDLSVLLPEKYLASRYCLIFVSESYINKIWTILERQSVIHEFFRRRGRDYILPVKVLGCSVPLPGLPKVIGYLNLDSDDGIADIVSAMRAKLTLSIRPLEFAI